MIESKSRVAIYCRLSEEDRNKQHETGCWRTQRIVNLILSFVRHNPDLPEN